MHRDFATARLQIKGCNFPGIFIDRIARYHFKVGVDRVKEPLVPIERQEGRVDDFQELFVGPGAGRVDSVDVDAAAMPFALRGRESADIGEHRAGAVLWRLRLRKRNAEKRGPHCSERRAALQYPAPPDPLCRESGICPSRSSLSPPADTILRISVAPRASAGRVRAVSTRNSGFAAAADS